MSNPSGKTAMREALGLFAFLVVATAQVSNMILARGLSGSVPPFALAFFRWFDRGDRAVAFSHRGGLSPAPGPAAQRRTSAFCARRLSRHVRLRRADLSCRHHHLGDRPRTDHGNGAVDGAGVLACWRGLRRPSAAGRSSACWSRSQARSLVITLRANFRRTRRPSAR